MDCIEPDEPRFTVSRFRDGAIEAANGIIAKGKRPLVVGGTGLYINALTYPLTFSQIAPDDELRAELMEKSRLKRARCIKCLRSWMQNSRASAPERHKAYSEGA